MCVRMDDPTVSDRRRFVEVGMSDIGMADAQEPDDTGMAEPRDSQADRDPRAGSRPLTGAERYFAERLRDPEYAAAFRAARRRLRRPRGSSREAATGSDG